MVEQLSLSDEEPAPFVRVSEVLQMAVRVFLLVFTYKKLSNKCFVK